MSVHFLRLRSFVLTIYERITERKHFSCTKGFIESRDTHGTKFGRCFLLGSGAMSLGG